MEIVRILARRKANVNQSRQQGESNSMALTLISYLNWRPDGVSPIFIASLKGHVEVVKALIDLHGDVMQNTHDGKSPVWIARQMGRLDIADLLSEV